MQLVILAIVSSLLTVPASVRGDAPAPSFSAGDRWKFDLQTYVLGGSLNGTLTVEVLAEETYTLSSGSYDSLKLQLTGSGPFAVQLGNILSGSWNLSSTLHARKSDSGPLKNTVKQTMFNATFWQTQISEETDNPPVSAMNWPLSVGKTWSTSTQASFNVTTYNSLYPTPVSTPTTTTVSATYTVNRTETITVAAGSFDTFLTTRNDPQTSQQTWYSSQARTNVKSLNYDRNGGRLISSQALTEYRAAAQPGFFSNPYVIAGIAGAAAVALVGAALLVRRRRRAPGPVPTPTGEIPSPPQGPKFSPSHGEENP